MLSELKSNSSFDWVSIEDVAELISGQHIKSDNYNESGEGLPYLTGPSDFGDQTPTISKWTNSPKATAKKGDVLITVKGAGVGKVNILDIKSAAISRQLMAIRSPNLHPKYLYFFVKSNYEYFQELGAGSTVPGINRKQILETEVPLPSLEMQKVLIDGIEQNLSLANSGRKNLETVESQVRNYRKSVIKSGLDGSLSETWREENTSNELEHAQDIDQDQELQETELFEIPERWVWVSLDSVVELISGRHVSSSDYNSNNDGTPYLTGPSDFGNESPEITKWTNSAESFAQKGDTLLTVKGSGVGKVNYLTQDRVGISRQLAAVRPIEMNSRFIYYYLNNKFQYFQKKGSGTIPGITREDILSLPVPRPPISEQNFIAEKIDRSMSVTDNVLSTLNQEQQRAEVLENSILKKGIIGAIQTDEERSKEKTMATVTTGHQRRLDHDW